jgi:hypothetical protein
LARVVREQHGKRERKEDGMYDGELTTGTRDEHYDLISVLYHALHGAENCEMYATDAEAAGREDLAAFFREVQATQSRLAERAKMLLGIVEAPPGGTAGPDIPAGEMTYPPPAPRSTVPLPDEDLIAEMEGVPPDTPREGPPGRAVPPDAPRTEEPPPRTGDAPPSPSEQPPR